MKLTSIFEKISPTSIAFCTTFLMLIVLISYLMSLLQAGYLSLIITLSQEQIAEYFVFNLDNPNIISAFLSNYSHKDGNHLCGNAKMTIVYALGIILVYLAREWMKIPVRKPYLFVFLGCSLLILPFFVSGVSYIFRAFLNGSCGGFSGITYSFIGALFALLIPLSAKFMSDFLKRNVVSFPSSLDFCGIIIAIFALFYCVIIVINDMQNPGTNYFAHITGFIFGFVITYLYDTYRIRKEMN